MVCTKCKLKKDFHKGNKTWCKDCVNAYNKVWYENNRERGLRWRKNGHLKRTYGITLDEFEVKLKEQNGVCAICGIKQEGKHLAVDHNHTTNKIRGLLCENCNRGVGMFKDNVALMQKAIDYLNHWY